jgi:DnaJ-class molecular chaperone
MFRFQSPSYALLGVSVSVGEQEIGSAYKTLALRHHPDKANAGQRAEATATFQKIQNAYEFCMKNVAKGINNNNTPG